jgi:hypothetical protein
MKGGAGRMSREELMRKLIAVNRDLDEIKQILRKSGHEKAADLIQNALHDINAAAESYNLGD